MSEDIKAQIKDLKRSKHDWEEGGDHKTPYPLDDLIAELEGKPEPKKRKR